MTAFPTLIPSPGPDGGGSTSTSTSSNGNILGLPSNREFFLWAISGITLLALADPYPNLAIFFMWLLVVGVLLMNSGDYIGLLNSAIGGK